MHLTRWSHEAITCLEVARRHGVYHKGVRGALSLNSLTVYTVPQLTLPAWVAEKPPWVGQSLGTERLGMTLTSRLRTPQTGPLISTGEVLPLYFSSPSLQSNFKVKDFLLWHQGSRRKKEGLVIRDRGVQVGRLLAT